VIVFRSESAPREDHGEIVESRRGTGSSERLRLQLLDDGLIEREFTPV